MRGELVRHWRGQEQRYLGPGSSLFEYQFNRDEQTGEVTNRRLRNKLKQKSFELLLDNEAEALVENLRGQQFTDEVIAKTALSLAALDRALGLPFAAEVLLLLRQNFDTEPARIEVMRILGFSNQEIIDWHMSVDGYAADITAKERLLSQVLG